MAVMIANKDHQCHIINLHINIAHHLHLRMEDTKAAVGRVAVVVAVVVVIREIPV
jgi:hypothetical protein